MFKFYATRSQYKFGSVQEKSLSLVQIMFLKDFSFLVQIYVKSFFQNDNKSSCKFLRKYGLIWWTSGVHVIIILFRIQTSFSSFLINSLNHPVIRSISGQYLKSDYESLFRIHSHKVFTDHRNIPRDILWYSGGMVKWTINQLIKKFMPRAYILVMPPQQIKHQIREMVHISSTSTADNSVGGC